MDSERDSIKVALRIRPLIDFEKTRGFKDVVKIFPAANQVQIYDKPFTFNFVCGPETDQEEFYSKCISPMLVNLYKGYNITILAYGQTGSGKTHSMGTSYTSEDNMGVIPRAVHEIFSHIKDNFSYEFNVAVSFIELYNESLYDLLSSKPKEQSQLEVREDVNKSTFIPGLTEVKVTSPQEALHNLQKASEGRVTACTNMNQQSSRSHAIFTISLFMQQKGSDISKTAKFHLVDLAGSERSKKTGATGQTFKEGVNINKGLLALGNVISALGGDKGQPSYVCYRESALTRILKDSLGGNSITLMIACVSPADYNSEETLSTLRYADRARKIRNKPIVNEDPKAAEINKLNKLIQDLRLQIVGQGGPVCPAEVELIRKEKDDILKKYNNLSMKLSITLNEKTVLLERVLLMQTCNENLTEKLNELRDRYNITINNLNTSLENSDVQQIKEQVSLLKSIQDQFTILNDEYQKNEDEIKKHEISAVRNNITESDTINETEINEQHESHAAKQIALNEQLQEVTKMLAVKEDLAKRIAENNFYMIDVSEMEELESKIKGLENEKEGLLQQLKSAQVQGVNNKLSEQRRKRVKELEQQLHDLNKKVVEQGRLIKMKQKDELKIKQLNNEIQSMKAMKVKLIKTMRQESDKFRIWKLARERELLKLKDNDRKLHNQMMKMETKYNRQQNVLKRKVEEAAAINKRLKDALALRKAAQDSKMNGKVERFGPLLQREFDVFVGLTEAKYSLETLLEDRATLQHQLDTLQKENANPNEIEQLEADIKLRSTQIQEFQQKILDGDEDKSKTILDNIQTMAEAKYVIKAMFDLTANNVKDRSEMERKISEMQNIQQDFEEKVMQLQNEKSREKSEFTDRLDALESTYEDKIGVLLHQLRGIEVKSGEQEVKALCTIQYETIDKYKKNNEQLVAKCKELEKENEELHKKCNNIEENLDNIKEVVHKQSIKSLIQPKIRYYDDVLVETTPNRADTSFEDDDKKDPDWKLTPISNRMRRNTFKRTSQGGCNCRSICNARCGCKKLNRNCNENCRCAGDACANRDGNDCEDSFKKPGLFNDVFKRKKTGDC